MRPPLVSQLVSGYKVSNVNVGRLEDAADEADTFRIRDRIAERLGEAAVARKLHDAELAELVAAEDALIVVQPGARAGQHIVDVISVRGIVIDLQRHVTVGPVIGLLPDLVARRDLREE